MKNKPYVKQLNMDIDLVNRNFGKPIITNPITKDSPFHNNVPFNRKARREAGKYVFNDKGVKLGKRNKNNRKETKGRISFRQTVYSFVGINLKKLSRKSKEAAWA